MSNVETRKPQWVGMRLIRSALLLSGFVAVASPTTFAQFGSHRGEGPIGPIIIADQEPENALVHAIDDEAIRQEIERAEQRFHEEAVRHLLEDRLRQGGAADPRLDADPIPSNEELAQIDISEELLHLASQLDNPEYEARERATEEIIKFSGDNLQIYALLAGQGLPADRLTSEQHVRLLAAVRERILNAPRGALGIRMDTGAALQRGWVEVSDLLPGLPAKDVLKVGDRITAIDGRALPSPQELTTRIQSRAPGEVVVLTVQRRAAAQGEFETLELPVTLGSAELLTDPETGQRTTAREVEQNRRREAAAVQQRFRREPVRITLAGELPPPRTQPQVSTLSSRVEQHPAIRQLRLMQSGAIPRDEGLLIVRLNQLQRQRNDPAISDDDREFLDAVIERYIEIVSEF